MGNFETHSSVEDGVDLAQLTIDQVYINYNSNVSAHTWIYSLSSQCHSCLPQLELSTPLEGGVSGTGQALSIHYPVDLYAANNDQGANLSSPCSKQEAFTEFGIYNCSVTEDDHNTLSCHCHQILEGDNIYWPLLCVIGFFLGLAALWLLLLFIYRKVKPAVIRWRQHRNSFQFASDEQNTEIKMTSLGPISSGNQSQQSPTQPVKTRIKSLDTFRGMCICTMIFVNYGGGTYWFFEHAPWNGLTFADLLFPSFLWIMGVCIPISVRSLYKRKGNKRRSFVKIFKRSLWLFLLGLAVSNINNIDVRVLRIFGVLQRFAITYLIVATLHLIFFSTISQNQQEVGCVSDIRAIIFEWMIQILIVMFHLLITFLLPVPDCPTGYLGPGGRHEAGRYFNCTGGAAGYIDRLVLGDPHCYQAPTSDAVYGGTVGYDPEGILGTLEACFTVFLGVQAGMILNKFKEWKPRIIRWLTWSLLTGALSAVLCRVSADDGWIPINKNLWSLSFVLVTACFDYFLLSLLYLLVDVLDWWNGAPFFYPGMNSIVLYVGHELCTAVFPFQWSDSRNASAIQSHGYQLVLDLWVTTAWVVLAIWMYSIQFFVAL